MGAAAVPSIAINDNGIDVTRDGKRYPAMAPFADILYASDSAWWRAHAQQALKFRGLKVTCMDSVEFRDVLCLRQTGTEGFDPNPRNIKTGGNSGYAAIHIAIHAGAKRILLLGFDMSADKGGHWFGRHTHGLRNTDPSSFDRWRSRFHALSGRGAKIINCTPGSRLDCFDRMDLTEALYA